ncbi:MAG TPA: sulfatase-like hydrolase/transferase [Capillimicrobium sp.]|nr:sulfatase-like hydrolase/transferase [Capillimicrobium sp.]
MGARPLSRLSRRGLLRAAGGAAGAAALGGVARPRTAAAAAGPRDRADPRDRPNVVLVVLDRMRARFPGRETPNLDDLADDALRFTRAIPDGTPSIPARNGLLTGMRTYPFRDWRATPPLPAIPGWNPVYDHQPLLTEVLEAAGVHVAWVSANPLLRGPRFERAVRRPAAPPPDAPGERGYLLPIRPGVVERPSATAPAFETGLSALEELAALGEPFFLAIDAFDPGDVRAPVQLIVRGSQLEEREVYVPGGPLPVRRVRIDPEDGRRDDVQERYAAAQRDADRWLGRVLDRVAQRDLAGRTAVIVVSDGAMALGEQGIYGHPAGVGDARAFHVPFLLRDPRRRMAGDELAWFASTYDVAPTVLGLQGISIPGRMAGEDLTASLDDEDVPARATWTSAIDTMVMVGDGRHVMVADLALQDRRLYDADEIDDEDDPTDVEDVTREDPEVLDRLWREAAVAAGGTLPEFGAERVIPPRIPDDDDERRREREEGDDADAD